MDRMAKILLLNMCMIIDELNNKVLVQDKVGKKWSGITFPGGHIENAESIIESTIREVHEETGLTVEKLQPCGLIDWCNAESNERWFVFLFKTTHFTGTLLEETEEGKVFWTDLEQLAGLKLAPGMDTYLELFFHDDVNEAYATWNENAHSENAHSDFRVI